MGRFRLSTFPEPNFEAIIYDERDRTSVDPSSTIGWCKTEDDALSLVMEYVADTAGIYRWEVRNRTGKLIRASKG